MYRQLTCRVYSSFKNPLHNPNIHQQKYTKDYIIKRINYKNSVDRKIHIAELHEEFASIYPKLVDLVSDEGTKQQLVLLHKVYASYNKSINYRQKIEMREDIKSIIEKDSTSQEVVDFCVEYLNSYKAF